MQESDVVCRYQIKGIIVDIMPTNDESIGFSNIWYAPGFSESIQNEINGITIQILNSCYFIATKIEAFKGRGKNDGRTSHDFEDFIFIFENREEIWEELMACKDPLRTYFKNEFNKLIQHDNILEWIDCHIERGGDAKSIFDKWKETIMNL